MNEFQDGRGRSWFDIFPSMSGQLNLTVIYPGIIKAFHMHKWQTDLVVCTEGALMLVTASEDGKLVREHFLSSDMMNTVQINPNTWHGYMALGNKPAKLLYWCNQKFNGEDEIRAPWNKFHSWNIENK